MDSSLWLDTINLGGSIVYRAVTCLTFHVSLTIIFLVVNSVDPNDMLHYAAFQISE